MTSILGSAPNHWKDLFLELPVCAVLPILPLVFPVMWISINLWGIARLETLLTIPQPSPKTDPEKSFEVDLDTPTFESATTVLPSRDVFVNWIGLWQGDSHLLGRSANVVQVLGSITALCCVDKKGILSWPNPTAEKVFFLRDSSEKTSRKSESSLESEVSLLQSNEMISFPLRRNLECNICLKIRCKNTRYFIILGIKEWKNWNRS